MLFQFSRGVDETEQIINRYVIVFCKRYVLINTHHLNTGFPLAHLLSCCFLKVCDICLCKIIVLSHTS